MGHFHISDNIAITFKSITFCKTVGGHTGLHLSYMALLAMTRIRSWVSAATTQGPNQYTIHTNRSLPTYNDGGVEGLLYDPSRKITWISGFHSGGPGSTLGVGIYFSDLLDNCQH